MGAACFAVVQARRLLNFTPPGRQHVLRCCKPGTYPGMAPSSSCLQSSPPALPQGAGGPALPGPWTRPTAFRMNHLFSCPVAFTHPASSSEASGGVPQSCCGVLGVVVWGRPQPTLQPCPHRVLLSTWLASKPALTRPAASTMFGPPKQALCPLQCSTS